MHIAWPLAVALLIPAAAAAAETRLGLGVDVYAFRPDALPAAGLGIVVGDGRGLDLDFHLSTIFIGTVAEIGPRAYLGEGAVRVYAFARAGFAMALFVPTDLAISSGGGISVALGRRARLDLDIGYFAALGGVISHESFGHGPRLSLGVSF